MAESTSYLLYPNALEVTSEDLIGREVIVLANQDTGQPNTGDYRFGERFLVVSAGNGHNQNENYVKLSKNTNPLPHDYDFQIHKANLFIVPQTYDELKEQYNCLVGAIETMDERMQWMENKGIDKFSELDFEVGNLINILLSEELESAEKERILKGLLKRSIKF